MNAIEKNTKNDCKCPQKNDCKREIGEQFCPTVTFSRKHIKHHFKKNAFFPGKKRGGGGGGGGGGRRGSRTRYGRRTSCPSFKTFDHRRRSKCPKCHHHGGGSRSLVGNLDQEIQSGNDAKINVLPEWFDVVERRSGQFQHGNVK